MKLLGSCGEIDGGKWQKKTYWRLKKGGNLPYNPKVLEWPSQSLDLDSIEINGKKLTPE